MIPNFMDILDGFLSSSSPSTHTTGRPCAILAIVSPTGPNSTITTWRPQLQSGCEDSRYRWSCKFLTVPTVLVSSAFSKRSKRPATRTWFIKMQRCGYFTFHEITRRSGTQCPSLPVCPGQATPVKKRNWCHAVKSSNICSQPMPPTTLSLSYTWTSRISRWLPVRPQSNTGKQFGRSPYAAGRSTTNTI